MAIEGIQIFKDKQLTIGFGGDRTSHYSSPWVSRQLAQLGHEVIVAHARNVRPIGESSRKDDRLDARTLARLGESIPRCSVMRHRSAKAQIHLTVIRARAALVSTRTALVAAPGH